MANKKEAQNTAKDNDDVIVESATETPSDNLLQEGEEVENSGSFISGGFVFGMVLIVLGALFLLNNLGFVRIHIGNVLMLWPLILIVVGVSMLSIRGVLGRILSVVLVIVLLGVLALAAAGIIAPNGQSGPSSDTQEIQVMSDDQATKSAKVSVEAGAGKLEIDSEDVDTLVQAHLESSFAQLQQSSKVSNGKQEVDIKTEGSVGWWSGNHVNDLFVTLNESIPLQLEVSSGASDITIDTSQVRLESLVLDSGASKVDLKLGNKIKDVSLDIDLGMSSMTLKLPEEMGVRIEIDSGLSNVEFDDLKKMGDGVYESDGFEQSDNRLTIVGDVGMSNFEIVRY